MAEHDVLHSHNVGSSSSQAGTASGARVADTRSPSEAPAISTLILFEPLYMLQYFS